MSQNINELANQVKQEFTLRDEMNNDNSLNNVILLAGAGSGKTSYIVNNVITQIESGIDVEKIVVISFTKKAAGEVRDRILNALINKKNPSDNIKKAINKFDLFIISTIHSFCYKLLSENAFYLDLPIDLNLIEENDEIERETKFFNNYVENDLLFPNIELYSFTSDFASLALATFIRYASLAEEKKLIKPNASFFEKQGLDLQKLIENLLINLKEIALQISNYNQKPENNKKLSVKKDYEILNNPEIISLHDKRFKSLVKNICSGSEFLPVDKRKKEFYADNEDTINEINELAINIIKFESNMILDYVIKVREAYYSYLKSPYEINRISNNQILFLTEKLLDSLDSKLLKLVRDKFSIVYLDEAQDVDPYQIKIAKKLSCINEPDENEHKLVIVGDPKQSIYSFRGANLDLFDNIRKELESYEKHYDFNFRSNKEIIDFINLKFDPKFKLMFHEYNDMIVPSASKANYDNEKIYSNTLHGSFIHKTVDKTINEAIKLILTLKDKGTIWDDQIQDIRPIKFSDFLIILKGNDSEDAKCRLFKEAGIKAISSASVGQKKNKYLMEIISLYKYLNEPNNKDNIFVAGQILMKKTISNEEQEDNKNLLIDLFQKTKMLSSIGKLQYLFKNYPLYCFDIMSEADLSAINMNFQNIYEEIVSQNCLSSIEIIDKLTEKLNGVIEYDLPLGKSQDCIRIMNQHKTKGLQENIVIVIGQDRISNKGINSYDDNNNIHVFAISNIGKNSNDSAIPLDEIDKKYYDIAAKKSDEEEVRLAYVSLTRVKQCLIYVCTDKDSWLRSYFDGEKNNDHEQICDIAEAYPSLFNNEEDNDSSTIIDNLDDNQEYLSGEALFTKTVDISEFSKQQYINVSPSDLESGVSVKNEEAGLKGRHFGNTLHRSLELLVNDLKDKKVISDLKCYAIQAINENYDDIILDEEYNPKDYLTSIMEILDRFNQSDIAKKITAATTVEAEFPFSFYMKLSDIKKFDENIAAKIISKNCDALIQETTDVWVNGKADLVIFNQDGSVDIIDYKSDFKDSGISINDFENNLHIKYDLQQSLYTLAISYIYNLPINKINSKIYFHRYS